MTTHLKSNPASILQNRATGPAPIIQRSVWIIRLKFYWENPENSILFRVNYYSLPLTLFFQFLSAKILVKLDLRFSFWTLGNPDQERFSQAFSRNLKIWGRRAVTLLLRCSEVQLETSTIHRMRPRARTYFPFCKQIQNASQSRDDPWKPIG